MKEKDNYLHEQSIQNIYLLSPTCSILIIFSYSEEIETEHMREREESEKKNEKKSEKEGLLWPLAITIFFHHCQYFGVTYLKY
jgi:hypothetical protein